MDVDRVGSEGRLSPSSTSEVAGDSVELSSASKGSTPSSPSNGRVQGDAKSLRIDVRNETTAVASESQSSATWPSLRGRYFIENDSVMCRGVWAMTDSAHGIPGQTSDFEFRLVSADGDRTDLPVNGKYTGWFMLKQTQNNSIRIEDKEMNIQFVKKEGSDEYDITGDGVNKFGKFNLRGTLAADNMVHLFKIYVPKKGAATPRGARPVSTRSSVGSSSRQARPALSAVAASPRESSTRKRRPSVVVQEATLTRDPPAPVPAPVPVPPVKRQSSTSLPSRPSRPPAFVSKCRDVLKEMSKQHLGIYFNEPVDHVKLGIPDYPTIIKEPMDFSTIATNLEQNVYSSHEEFAEHMRLVFRNAITYNVRRDNPVHIAAREMSDMFEERYRVMVSQLGSYALPTEYEVGLSGSLNKKGKGKKGRASTGGPRAVEPVSAAMALDSSMQTMRMMQQRMQEMEEEINNLRAAVRQSDIRATLGQQMAAAQVPLSYEEKKILIANIAKLDGDQMTSVVDIIQSAMPHTACGDGDEVEIPLDELDTYTLRQLQEYVQSVFSSKSRKRASSASATSRSGAAPKRSRASSSTLPTSMPSPEVTAAPQSSFFADAPTADYAEKDSVTQQSSLMDDSSSRRRSNSLDLFPDSAVGEDTEGYTAWASDSLVNEDQEQKSVGQGGTWGGAVEERNDQLQRDATLKAEAEKLNELRAKAEAQRVDALKEAMQRQNSATSKEIDDRNLQLERLRNEERARRESMEPTVELNDAHSALFDHESFGL